MQKQCQDRALQSVEVQPAIHRSGGIVLLPSPTSELDSEKT